MKKKEKFVLYSLFSILILLMIFLIFLRVRVVFLKESNVYIYLVQYKNNQTFVIPVKRKIKYCRKIEDRIKNTINELLKGPKEEEKKAGFFSAINENAEILNVTVQDKIVNLDFSKEVEEGGGTLTMETRIVQIVYTATQFPEIKKVRFLIEGKTIDYFSGEGITIVEKPVGREDLKEFDIKIIEEEENEKRYTS